MSKHSLPICACLTRDGSRCGRRVADGSNPPVCHIHRAQQEGKGALTQPAPFDPDAKLLKIAAKDGHPHQLQAIRMLRDRESCRACAARAAHDQEFQTFWRNLTDDDKARLAKLLATLKEIKTEVRNRISTQGTEQ